MGRIFLLLGVSAAVVIALLHFRTNWISDGAVDRAAGVMIAMSTDLTHGVFYRPLFGTYGYGGTRYFPLYFVLHAILMKLGIPVLLAAYLLSGTAMLALLLGVYCLLRSSGAEPWLAAACTGVLLTSVAPQYAVVSPHADGLACALNVWGLLFVVDPRRRSHGVVRPAILFTLAWSAKLTTCFGLAVAVVWLWTTGCRRRVVQLALGTAFGYLIVAAAMFAASGGRILTVFKACASGGMTWKQLVESPLFLEASVFHQDLSAFLLICVCLILLLGDLLESPGICINDWSAMFFIATGLVTILIFGSPGTNLNHVLDMEVAAVLYLGCLATRPRRLQKYLAIVALVAMVIPTYRNGAALVFRQHKREDSKKSEESLGSVLAALRDVRGPVLAENPVIPVLLRQTPYILDPWMLSSLRERIPEFGDPLLQQLRDQAFGAVVLLYDPETGYGRDWYATEDFGPGFANALEQHYRLSSVTDEYFVYVPRIGSATTRSKER